MVFALPNLTLTITPPGGAPAIYTTYLAYDGANTSNTITQNFGRQGDTATFALVEDYGNGPPQVVVSAASQIELYDNTVGDALFSGVVTVPGQSVLSVTSNEWDLGCVDYTLYADAADVHGTWYGYTVDQIVVAITAQAGCGITAVLAADGGYVNPGPQLASFVFNYGKLSDAWRQLASLASSATPYGWYVDQNLELHFFDATSADSSGVTVTTDPTAYGSTTEAHITLDSTNAYQWDASTLANKILVQGATQTVSGGSPSSSPPTDVWLATGVQTAWPLRYTVSGTPTLYVGGVTTTVAVATAGTSVTGAWVVEQNSVGAYFLVAADAPAAGTQIQIWYTYQVPIVAQAQDTQSQATYTGPNGGVYSLFVSDSSLTTMPMALAQAFQQRTEYAFAVERATFNTTEDFIGWIRAGWTIRLINQFLWDDQTNTFGIDDTFIVIANEVGFIADGGYRTMQITAVRV